MSSVIKSEPKVYNYEVVIARWEPKECVWHNQKLLINAFTADEAKKLAISWLTENKITGVIQYPMCMGC